MVEVEHMLRELADTTTEYREFNIRIVATADPATVIGVRVPNVRKVAKKVQHSELREPFLAELPHAWYEEYLVHAFVLNEERDLNRAVRQLNSVLPWVDNWSVSDSLNPKAFNGKSVDVLLPLAQGWMASNHTYTRRFGVSVLMHHLLDEGYDPSQLRLAVAADNGEYYVSMMVAWYLAEAMVTHEDDVMDILNSALLNSDEVNSEELNPRLIRMTIQKAIESRRIPPQTKDHLRQMRKSLPRK